MSSVNFISSIGTEMYEFSV